MRSSATSSPRSVTSSVLKIALVVLLGISNFTAVAIREATASGVEDYPAPRFAHSKVYDAESDRIIMFGGLLEPAPTWSDETWAYDFNTNTWRNMTPAESPRSRSGHTMVYDSESDRVIIFGGAADIGPRDVTFGDTWAYDLNTNTWANLTTPTTTTTTTTATTTTTTTTLPTETTTTLPPSQAVSTTTIGIGAAVAIATVLAIYLIMRKK